MNYRSSRRVLLALAVALGVAACSSPQPATVKNAGYGLEALPQGDKSVQKPNGMLDNNNLPGESQTQ